MPVQIVAARKNIIDKYIEIVKKAKLVPRAIEPETIALGRSREIVLNLLWGL
jgi:Tfp pilus assembly PilM family ATPase